jgi:hypothetical protein
MPLAKLIDDAWRKSGIATATGPIVKRSKSLFGAGLY